MIPRTASRLSLIPLAVTILVAGCDDDRALLGPEFLARATAATGLTANAISHSLINLAWQDNATNESGWEVHRSTTGPTGGFALYTTTGANVSAMGDGGLQASTEYCYTVRSLRTTGRRTTYGEFSNVACATTLAAPLPAAPSVVNATPRYYRIDLTWADNSTDETGFRVERSAASNGPWTSVATKGANVTSHSDYVSPEQPACYRVIAFNSFGDSGPSEVDCTAVPAAPTDLAAAVSGAIVDLTWVDNSLVEDGYEIQRAGADWIFVVVADLPPDANSYRDAGVIADRLYLYRVRAKRDGGYSDFSNEASAVTSTTLPSAPLGVAASPLSSSSVSVWWYAGSENTEGFRVERSTDGGASWTTAGGTETYYATGFTDEGLASERQVCYRVFAVNRVGESPPSDQVCTTTPAGPTGLAAVAIDDWTLELTWSDESAVEDGYEVWFCNWAYCDLAASLPANSTSVQVSTGYERFYYVIATKDGGYSDPSDSVYTVSP